MASAMNGNGGGGGGVKISLRLQYYCILVVVVAVVVVASLRFMPAAVVAARDNFRAAGGGGGGGDGGGGGGDGGGGGGGGGDGGGGGGSIPVVIFNFGDSNSDTGGVAAAMGIHIALPEGRTFFHHPTGRLSDGRVIIDFICESLNTHHLSPYLKPLGSDFSNGVNFAIAGSTATPGLSPFSLNMQLEQFLFFKQRSQELINQGLKGPIDQEGFKNALYTMDIGQNDVTALLHLPYDQTLAKFPPIVAEIKNAVQTLYRDGGRKFWIHGTGALGCLPQKLAMPRKDDSDLDKNGCLKTFNKAAKAFNALLSDVCDQLRWQMTDAAIVYTDLFAIKYDLVANHTKYGIEKPLMTCCGFGGPPYNYDPTRSCMSVDAQLCAYGSKFISWDGVHFTDAANGIVAAKILTGEFSKPKIKLASLINSSKSVDN